jgi:hypothetical protein
MTSLRAWDKNTCVAFCNGIASGTTAGIGHGSNDLGDGACLIGGRLRKSLSGLRNRHAEGAYAVIRLLDRKLAAVCPVRDRNRTRSGGLLEIPTTHIDHREQRTPDWKDQAMLAALAESNVPGVVGFHSDRADIVHEVLSRRLSRHRFNFGRSTPMDARIYSADVGSIQIVDLQYGAEIDVEAHLAEDHLLIHLALAGETTMWTDGENGSCARTNCSSALPIRPCAST